MKYLNRGLGDIPGFSRILFRVRIFRCRASGHVVTCPEPRAHPGHNHQRSTKGDFLWKALIIHTTRNFRGRHSFAFFAGAFCTQVLYTSANISRLPYTPTILSPDYPPLVCQLPLRCQLSPDYSRGVVGVYFVEPQQIS